MTQTADTGSIRSSVAATKARVLVRKLGTVCPLQQFKLLLLLQPQITIILRGSGLRCMGLQRQKVVIDLTRLEGILRGFGDGMVSIGPRIADGKDGQGMNVDNPQIAIKIQKVADKQLAMFQFLRHFAIPNMLETTPGIIDGLKGLSQHGTLCGTRGGQIESTHLSSNGPNFLGRVPQGFALLSGE